MILGKLYKENIEKRVPSFDETKRYMRAYKDTSEVLADIIAEQTKKIYNVLTPRVIYTVDKLTLSGDGDVAIGDFHMQSKSLTKWLEGCEYACMFASSVGADVDRVIRAQGAVSAICGFACDAAAVAAIEDVCDDFCEVIRLRAKEHRMDVTKRFSAGYGDLSIDYQGDILKLLDTKKNIGVSLTVGGMMTPTKSVTAIFGIKKS